jgi:hypothetical protein
MFVVMTEFLKLGIKKNSSPDCALDWRSDVNRVLDNYQLP